jgi:hypothetical protein
MIERWLVAIRDHPARPPAMQRHVLACLALRLDWKTGRGFTSTAQVMADSDASKATVKRATRWGRDLGFLLQTRRGQRLGNGQVAASEWRLTVPVDSAVSAGHRPQGLMGDPLRSQGLSAEPQGLNGEVSRAQPGHLKGSPQTPHQELDLQESSTSSARVRAGAADAAAPPHPHDNPEVVAEIAQARRAFAASQQAAASRRLRERQPAMVTGTCHIASKKIKLAGR